MKKHYFLLASLVIYQRDKLERQKPLNIIIVSETATVNRSQLGRAQQQAQVRFFTEFDRERKSEVIDVFIQSISYLGHMTEKEFHAEFYVDPNAPAEPEGEPVDDGLTGPEDTGEAEQLSEAIAEETATADAPETEAKE